MIASVSVSGITPNLADRAQKAMRAGIKTGMSAAAKPLTDAGRADIKSKLAIRRKSALNAWKPKVLPDAAADKPTALVARLKFRWMTIHQTGGDIKPGKYMFLRKGDARISEKKVKADLAAKRMLVIRKGRYLMVYKVAFTKSGKRKPDLFVGILVPQVRIKKKLDMDATLTKFRPTLDKILTDSVSAQLATL